MTAQAPVLDSFIKRYSDRNYKYPVLVRHQGTVIALAMDDQRRIYYSVLNLNGQDSALDVNQWADHPQELEFPKEIAEVGFGLADQLLLPTVKKGSRDPVDPGAVVADNEEDKFLSRTARLTADAPFQAMSDGRFVYVFRQAIAAGHPDQITVEGPDQTRVAIVDSTLLVDRFVLSGASASTAPAGQAAPAPQLKLNMEVRFRRSRSKTRPQSTKDSLGARDMQDQPFFEPTQELSFIRNLQDGRFSMVLLPTTIAEVSRWQIFAFNSATGLIDAYNVERSLEGLFNTRGTQAITTSDAAETALDFSQVGDHIVLAPGVLLGQGFSQETWIFPRVTAPEPGTELEQALLGADEKTADAPPSIWIVDNRRVRVGFGDGTEFHSFMTGEVLRSNQWNHLAVVFSDRPEEAGYHLYVNGLPVEVQAEGSASLGKQSVNAPLRLIGAPSRSFAGLIDEIRLWNRPRSEREIRSDRGLRLTGEELGLIAYWRLDEGSGGDILDQTGNHAPGTLSPGFADRAWVVSDAPIGENAGVNRDSFRVEGRTVASGMASLLYFQQEAARTGYDQQAKPLRQGARVMLAVATQAAGDDQNQIATLDFGVSASGRLAKIPDNLALRPVAVERDGDPVDVSAEMAQIQAIQQVIDQRLSADDTADVSAELAQIEALQTAITQKQQAARTVDVNAELERIQTLQGSITQKTQRATSLGEEIDYLNRVYRIVDDAIANRSIASSVPAGSLDSLNIPAKLSRLRDLRNLQANGQRDLQQLTDFLGQARVTVYEHANFGGRALSFGLNGLSPRFVGYTQLNQDSFNDLISSIGISSVARVVQGQITAVPALQVTAYQHANRNDGGRQDGFVHTFSETTAFVGRDFNDRISSLDIAENPAFRSYRDDLQQSIDALATDLASLLGELTTIRANIDALRTDQDRQRRQLEQAVISDRTTLAALQNLLNKGFAATMPLVHSDVSGLSTAGGLLSFAWSTDTPLLFDSAVGNVAMYFRGSDDQFFVAYYKTLTQRARYALNDALGAETVVGFARATEAEMDRIRLDITGPETESTCTVTLAVKAGDQSITETWQQVPRQPQGFAKVLNGLAGDRTFVGRGEIGLVDGRAETLAVAEGIHRSLPAGATLFIGDLKATLAAAVDQGATALEIRTEVANPAVELLPVFFLEYDYAAHASTTQGEVDLSSGSRLLAFVANGTGQGVKNGTVRSGVTLTSRWVAESPGHTYAFNGKDSSARLEAATPAAFNQQLRKFSPKDDLTLEAWVRPSQIAEANLRSRVLYYQPQPGNSDSRYLLGLKREELNTAIALNGSTMVVTIPAADPLNFAGVITLEAWVKPAANENNGNIIVHGNNGGDQVYLRLNEGRYETGCQQSGVDHRVSVVMPAADRTGAAWVHLAGVYDGGHWRLYRNGIAIGEQADTVGAVPVAAPWGLGSHPTISSRILGGAIAEARIWKRGRTQAEIAADMSREVSGSETDLVGCWRFDDFANQRATDHSRFGHHGTLVGNPQPTESPLPAYSVFAGVGAQLVQAPQTIAAGNWNHLAAVFNQSYGVQLDGQPATFLDAGKDLTLDINRDLTLEVAFQVNDLSQPRALLTKGKISTTEDPEQRVPYALYLNPAGRAVFAFEDVQGNKHLFVSEPIANPTAFHTVTVSRKRNTITNPVRNNDGQQTGVDIVSWDVIQFFVDGQANTPSGQPYGLFEYKKAGSDTTGTPRVEDSRNEESPSPGFNAGKPQQPVDIGNSNDPLEFGSGFALAGLKHFSGDLDSINGVTLSPSALLLDGGRLFRPQEGVLIAQAAGIAATAAELERNSNLLTQARRVFENGQAIAPLDGVLAEIRLWNLALEAGSLKPTIQGGEQGLLSWWRFEEAEGTLAFDSKGSSNARFKGAVRWVKDPNPSGSQLVLYRNGQLIPSEPVPAAEQAALLSPHAQFTLGGIRRNGQIEELFQGELEEVRIWHSARTLEQVQDNLFRRLLGENEQFLDNREDLLAYYPFDTQKAGVLSDYSLLGNDLVPYNTEFVLSTAPIGEDTPQVRSALAGVRTPFSDRLQSTPAVQEYGDLQTDVDGNLFGIYKRCYGLIKDGQWELITGFKVGELVTEWVGQVQFDPQLIGFIEGAPPVPGENLTSTSVVLGEFADYNGASSVELKQASKTNFTFSADKESGFDSSFDLTAGLLTKLNVKAGIGLVIDTVDTDGAFGIKAKFENSLGWLSAGSTSLELANNLSSKQQLQGFVEPPDAVAFGDVGRRFVTENMGFALVQSQTADVFALRLKHNSALVSYQMRPNPDIPPDRNIINFPLNPAYTKQGSLDGKVGFTPDPAYPNALTYSNDSSFYKPVEAFALKQRIQREEERVRAYYDQYDAGAVGRRQNVLYGQQGDLGSQEVLKTLPQLEKRNLANTYVWTADGGLFAETQETMDVVQESYGGSYAFKGLAGAFADLSVAIGGVGFKLGFEALFGGRLNVQANKSVQSENAFSVDISVDGVERDVFLRDAAGNVLFDRSNPLSPKALRQPGKVDAYRFMTFYLEPQADHFDQFFSQVVDPIWLEQSTDANALALRGLRDANKGPGTKPPCWRIFHRVTFVSRVLPPIGSTKPLPALESTLRELSIDSNFELIKRLDPFVADKVDDFGEFSRAVRDTIATYLPELQPHLATITEFMRLFYGVTETTSLADSPELTALLEGDRAPNAPPVVRVGRSQTLRLEDEAVQTTLPGSVADDRLSPEAIFVTWAVQSAPAGATVSFDDRHSPVAIASFSNLGRYQLTLTASDGTLSTTEPLDVLVNQSPIVRAGDDQEIGFRQPLELRGELVRDGRGERQLQTLTTRWEAISGPGTVTFDNPAALRTRAVFSASGVYLLRLTAETTTASGVLSHSDDLQVFVGARINRSLLSLYSFADSLAAGTVRDVAGTGAPADLTITGTPVALTAPGAAKPFALALKSLARLTSTSASRLNQAIKASGEFTLEAWINPSQANQPGLGRILTLSGGASSRNLILGQAGGQFHLGVRTSETNLNASDRALAGGTITPGTLTHVVCTREASGQTRLYINNQMVAQRAIAGSLANWDESFALSLGNELGDNLSQERAWLGDLHLVALYSSALSPAEIATNFEVGADANLAPVVSAGGDQVINLPGSLTLKGVVIDDQLLTGDLSVLWSQPGGPSPVTFSDPSSLEPTVSFVAPGTSEDKGQPFQVSGVYTLRLTVGDEAQSISDEVTITVNHAPRITVPNALVVQLPNRAQLTAEVQSGLGTPQQGRLTLTWSQLSGPGTVSFGDPTLARTTAQFSESGTYLLRLTASNGLLTAVADVTVYANKAPQIRASAAPLVNLPAAATLQGEIVDTGLADPAGTVTTQWSRVSGPGNVTFADADALTTTATFSASGEYTLRLTVSTGELSTSREVTLTANQAPVVDAGPDQTIDFPALAELDGTASDDGFPSRPGRLTLTWSKVSGPGNVTFADPASDITTAQFSQGGQYVLRLTASDGAIAAADELTIQVNQPPVVNAGADQVLTLPPATAGAAQPAIATATLSGTVQDDGLPAGTLTILWKQISGPAAAAIANPAQAATQVTFAQAGTYVLELSASDGRLTGRSTVRIVVSRRVVAGVQALYDFREGTGNTIRDRSGIQPALDLTLVNGAIARLPQGQGIALQQPSLLATSGAATRLSQEIRRTQALTVEAWVKPTQATYSQLPARIVTLSANPGNRNVTLGQDNSRYVTRLRTTTTGGNGDSKVLEAGQVSLNQLSHLVYTRDNSGHAAFYVNGQLQQGTTIDGNLSNWDEAYRLALGNELTSDRPWLGEYHLVALYNRALSAEEVSQNFAASLA
ncbi:LamG-like jellyroll fold domain-containing protein [Nodosilinea nodulosa]|uniref:LamG-like jellyroll fold domain-containing protein n=1 Tax=Nodosilinea nodulosa TaxID=416001 RepID=UPI0003063786|nr:LamG-like jellyroll fold domain-containing protein [Nodosilinea nodulosa]